MMISEVFYSIQGEGSLVGTPSIFVRTSGCNLRCVWCDTPYTSWKPEGEQFAMGGLLGAVRKFYWCSNVVVTGGEPMIAEEIVLFTQRLREHGYHITIETAGTVYEPVTCDLMSISPKLSGSTPVRRDGGRWASQHDRLRYQPDTLKELIKNFNYQLKFVITRPEEIQEVRTMVDEIEADRSRVILMPEGIEPGVLWERSRWLVELCKDQGYRFSPRLHIDIWSNERAK
jgi:7-carboxy-7-deazaguanine synthase